MMIAPHSHGVEILKSQSERVHSLMAGSAKRLLSMDRHEFPHARLMAFFEFLFGLFELGHVWRGRRGGCPKNILEDEQPSLDG